MQPRLPRALRPPRRRLHLSAYTLLSPTPESLAAHLAAIPPASSRSGTLFSLSTSLTPSSLPPILELLHAQPNAVVGGFHLSSEPSLALATFEPENEGDEATSSIRAWRSEASGRGAAQVGRWQRESGWAEDARGAAPGELESMTREGGWDTIWNASGESAPVPTELKDFDVHSLLLMTDGTPQPVLAALDAAYPRATKLGLISAPTPFLTGRPHTLFYQGKPCSTGTVGLALSTSPKTRVAHNVEPLDAPATVGSARGNLLLRLEGAANSNPTQSLISALQRRDGARGRQGLSKEEDFWLAITDAGSLEPRVVRILSGDPSRGALSLETDCPLLPGQIVQFMHRPFVLNSAAPAEDAITLAVLARTDEIEQKNTEKQPRTTAGFLAASEDGFIYSSTGRATDICTVAGATTTAGW